MQHSQEVTQVDVVNQAITSGNDYQLHIFESRYSRGTIALLTFDSEFGIEVEEYFGGSDDDNGYIGDLLQLSHYPCAAGNSVIDAIGNLNQKLQGITPTENTPPFLTWLKYVGAVNHLVSTNREFEAAGRQWEKQLDQQLKAVNATGN